MDTTNRRQFGVNQNCWHKSLISNCLLFVVSIFLEECKNESDFGVGFCVKGMAKFREINFTQSVNLTEELKRIIFTKIFDPYFQITTGSDNVRYVEGISARLCGGKKLPCGILVAQSRLLFFCRIFLKKNQNWNSPCLTERAAGTDFCMNNVTASTIKSTTRWENTWINSAKPSENNAITSTKNCFLASHGLTAYPCVSAPQAQIFTWTTLPHPPSRVQLGGKTPE